jgi:hypothetical protein
MTHDELLAICDNYSFKDSAEPVKALRAVVELHKPWNTDRFGEPIDVCVGCFDVTDDHIVYPCPTIRAIEKELR